ncbi:MAG: hypothetical protein FJY65_00860 [Calditrichaeota bacterium]|nr:hypothetical protein [Calditrichota bacterium]
MNRTILTILCLLWSSVALAADLRLSEALFQPDATKLFLTSSGLTPSGKPDISAVEPVKSAKSSAENTAGSELNPGKALILSAIWPGAGEYYAGYKWRAAAFTLLELAAWTGVIYFYNQGMGKDKEFKAYADAHFDPDVYRQKEYDIARTYNVGRGDTTVFTGSLADWTALNWETKLRFLPNEGFTHDLPTDEQRAASKSDDQQYYEMIGKYIKQFGFGWDDVFQMVGGIITGYLGDDPNTPQYDNKPEFGGFAQRSLHYMDMRYASNQRLEYSSISIQVAMLNHVMSALHASFTVRALKRKAKAEVGFHKIEHNGRPLAVGGLNFRW